MNIKHQTSPPDSSLPWLHTKLPLGRKTRRTRWFSSIVRCALFSNIQKTGSAGWKNPPKVSYFPKKDCLRMRKPTTQPIVKWSYVLGSFWHNAAKRPIYALFLWKMIENLRTFSSNIFGLKSKFFRHFYFLDVCRFYSSTLGLAVKFLRHKIEMGWTESGLRYARQKNYSGDTKTKPWPPSALCF